MAAICRKATCEFISGWLPQQRSTLSKFVGPPAQSTQSGTWQPTSFTEYSKAKEWFLSNRYIPRCQQCARKSSFSISVYLTQEQATPGVFSQ